MLVVKAGSSRGEADFLERKIYSVVTVPVWARSFPAGALERSLVGDVHLGIVLIEVVISARLSKKSMVH